MRKSGHPHQLLELMKKNANILLRLVNQILDFRKVENGRMELHLEPFDLLSSFRGWNDSFRMALLKKHISFSFEVTPDTDFRMMADSEKMERIYFNLLSNAVKYTPENGKIVVKLEAETTNYRFSVFNSGSHISPKEVDAIFERFYQIDGHQIMRNKLLFSSVLLAASVSLSAQKSATITLHADQGTQVIPKEIYGQFAEHLGTCIYGGLWVGENSDIPNIKGYRTDVFNALKELQVPVLRWPGGCFADEYHWMDGIGPKENRPKMVNNNWGGTIEDNSFGTHEFLNLCEMLGTEPYISGNVGSGTVEELAKWVEYMTSEGDSPMARLRRQNGRDKAWKVKYLGVGNESWGCGGSMRPEYYADLYRRYSTYCRNYDGNHLFKIASGASDYDYNWTKVLMDRVGGRMNGLSLHYYTVTGWSGSKGAATKFDKSNT